MGLFGVQLVRQVVLIPFVISTVPLFALDLGLDALSLALNCLAVTFIMEADNTAFSLWVNQKQQDYLQSVEVETATTPVDRPSVAMTMYGMATFFTVFLPFFVMQDKELGTFGPLSFFFGPLGSAVDLPVYLFLILYWIDSAFYVKTLKASFVSKLASYLRRFIASLVAWGVGLLFILVGLGVL